MLLDFIDCGGGKLLLRYGDVLGKPLSDVIPSLAGPVMRFARETMAGGQIREYESVFRLDVDARLYQVKLLVSGQGKTLAVVHDVTDMNRESSRENVPAYHDSLTNLPNRYLFYDRLKNAMANAVRKKSLLALLHIDLDNFKRINETLGNDAGDRLLSLIAERLASSLRKTDALTRYMTSDLGSLMARIGGDEFTILLNEIANIHDAALVCERIINILSDPFSLDNNEVFVTASIGISVYPLDSHDANSLMTNADIAMHQAKKQGRNKFHYYADSMNTSTMERFTIENKLRRALEREEFMLFYQPQIDLSSGRIIGVEALIRWLQPDLVLVKPGNFIPVTEETGLIIPIGKWILQTACAQNKSWQREGIDRIHITVNVSSIQFQQDSFVDVVAQALCDSELDASCLKLELTESTLMKNSQNSMKKMDTLREMGIQISIDDFGTGYSCLNYLKRFPVEVLKIDRSFIKDIETDSNDQAIVRAIIALAHNLNIQVIAEGVETTKQMGILRGYGCDAAQGFLFCPPIHATSLAQFIRQRMSATAPKV